MKAKHAILALSLIVNLLLVSLLIKHSAVPSSAPTKPASGELGKTSDQAIRSALPPAVARNLAIGQSLATLKETLQANQPHPPSDPRYWHNAEYLKNPYSPEQQARITAAQREFAADLFKEMGENVYPGAGRDPRRSFLPPEKLNHLIGIEREFNDAVAAVNAAAKGLRLPSDDGKLAQLQESRDAAIGALLTPDEREQMASRQPPKADPTSILSRIAGSIESEGDYRTVHALQKAFDEMFPATLNSTQGISAQEASQRRREAMPELTKAIQDALGSDRFQALIEATDLDRRRLQSIETRLSLPGDSVERALAVRNDLASLSQAIANNTSISVADRRTQIAQLAGRAKRELISIMGAEGGEAYAARAEWIRYLSNGTPAAGNSKQVPAPMAASMGYPLGFNSAPLPFPND